MDFLSRTVGCAFSPADGADILVEQLSSPWKASWTGFLLWSYKLMTNHFHQQRSSQRTMSSLNAESHDLDIKVTGCKWP